MQVPLIQAFALYAAICARYDHEFTAPNYGEQELVETIRRQATSAPAFQ
jgi:hypothetical protein